MNQLIRRSVLPALILLVLAGCGTSQEVNSSSGSHGAAARLAAAAATPTTTTTAAPTGVPLSDVPVVNEGITPMHGPIKMNTVVYDNSVYDNLSCSAGFVWVFDLNRAYDRLTGVVGLDDTSVAQQTVTLTVKGDNGQVLNTTQATLGTVTPLSVSVAGMLRLRIEVTQSGGTCLPASGYGSTVAIGNASLSKAAK